MSHKATVSLDPVTLHTVSVDRVDIYYAFVSISMLVTTADKATVSSKKFCC